VKSRFIDEIFDQTLVAEDKPKRRFQTVSIARDEQQMRVFRAEEHRWLGLRGAEAREGIHQILRLPKIFPVEGCPREARMD
jgi:hypothetical protein